MDKRSTPNNTNNRPAVIGVDLGGTNVRSGKVVNGKITKSVSTHVRADGSEGEVIAELIQCIESTMDSEVEAIGVGVPAIVNTEKGVVYDVQNIPAWVEVPLKAILEKHFKVPVYVNNDANCFAAAEWHYGKGKGRQNVVGLVLGTGVAAGLICNNRLYEGRNCGAGEFGMMPYLERNFEFYCSGNYFTYFHDMTGAEAYSRAQNGDLQALQIFHEYGRHLNWLIRSVLYAVDPELIVLGGSVSKAFPFFHNSLWSHLQDFPYKPVIENIVIEPSETENIALLGAAALHFNGTPNAIL